MQGFNSHETTSTQKVGLAFLVLFGILTIGVSALQIRNTIYNPFAPEPQEATDQEALAQLFADDQVRLQSIDTDQDGLNDFEELTFYETSPYIPDTDSDGVTDKDEIAAGEDPLCPRGEVCGAAETLPNDNPTITSGVQVPGLEAFFPGEQAPEQVTEQDVTDLLSDPDALRDLLRQTGQLSDSQIDGFSDDQLLELADEVYAQQ